MRSGRKTAGKDDAGNRPAIDTKAIVESIRQAIDAGVNKEVIKPFMQRTEELSEEVLPTLKQIRSANEEAGRVWPGRIWKMSFACGLVLGLAVATVGIWAGRLAIKRNYEQTLAEQIANTTGIIVQNKKVFDDLAIAQAPIYLSRSTDANGNTMPSGFCLYIQGAQAADTQDGRGRIFFTSPRSESELRALHHATERAAERMER